MLSLHFQLLFRFPMNKDSIFLSFTEHVELGYLFIITIYDTFCSLTLPLKKHSIACESVKV